MAGADSDRGYGNFDRSGLHGQLPNALRGALVASHRFGSFFVCRCHMPKMTPSTQGAIRPEAQPMLRLLCTVGSASWAGYITGFFYGAWTPTPDVTALAFQGFWNVLSPRPSLPGLRGADAHHLWPPHLRLYEHGVQHRRCGISNQCRVLRARAMPSHANPSIQFSLHGESVP